MPTLAYFNIAKDRRLYDGCPSSELKKEWNNTKSLEEQLKQVSPNARCTYFPVEQGYLVFVGYRPLTGRFHESKQLALIEAYEQSKTS